MLRSNKLKPAAVVTVVAAAWLLSTAGPAAAAATTPGAVCGSGYKVINSKDLGPAVIYLTYNSSNGYNCVTTILDSSTGAAMWMGASIQKSGGSEIKDFGGYTKFAGPVYVSAANTCVKWGGGVQDVVWKSGWEHCG
ncbi:spore-associated protein A [Streptomyces paludis]|uniref:Spore-associated protein A n=1 Tax=Streptomyces paludis TaxID=2282738 RepID=A0A345I1D7_9ACTN|nr:spore-associated protein A [Streptomyces paludis]